MRPVGRLPIANTRSTPDSSSSTDTAVSSPTIPNGTRSTSPAVVLKATTKQDRARLTLLCNSMRSANFHTESAAILALAADEDAAAEAARAIGLGAVKIQQLYRKIVTMPDGAMLMAVYGTPRSEPGKPPVAGDWSYIYRSTDDGQTWSRFATPRVTWK